MGTLTLGTRATETLGLSVLSVGDLVQKLEKSGLDRLEALEAVEQAVAQTTDLLRPNATILARAPALAPFNNETICIS